MQKWRPKNVPREVQRAQKAPKIIEGTAGVMILEARSSPKNQRFLKNVDPKSTKYNYEVVACIAEGPTRRLVRRIIIFFKNIYT